MFYVLDSEFEMFAYFLGHSWTCGVWKWNILEIEFTFTYSILFVAITSSPVLPRFEKDKYNLGWQLLKECVITDLGAIIFQQYCYIPSVNLKLDTYLNHKTLMLVFGNWGEY